MPHRYIPVPPPVQLCDPDTGDVLEALDPLTFERFVTRQLFYNPLWNKLGWQGIEIMKSIRKALKKSKEKGGRYVKLTQEEWEQLDACCKKPEYQPMGALPAPGFGYHPSIAEQLEPLVAAIVEAKTKEPEDEEAPPSAAAPPASPVAEGPPPAASTAN